MTHEAARGLTMPAEESWVGAPRGFLRYERTRVLGGTSWEDASAALLSWGVKTRSGFSVTPPGRVLEGARPTILVGALGVRVREPVEVVAVVDTPVRAAFAYRTLPGHPVRGEEAFILSRAADDPEAPMLLTLRSLTRPSDRLGWALAFPLLLCAQAVVRRRYFEALMRGLPERSASRGWRGSGRRGRRQRGSGRRAS